MAAYSSHPLGRVAKHTEAIALFGQPSLIRARSGCFQTVAMYVSPQGGRGPEGKGRARGGLPWARRAASNLRQAVVNDPLFAGPYGSAQSTARHCRGR